MSMIGFRVSKQWHRIKVSILDGQIHYLACKHATAHLDSPLLYIILVIKALNVFNPGGSTLSEGLIISY